jgi:hypothetical protein
MKKRFIYLFVLMFIGLNELVAQPTLPGQGPGGGNVEDNPIHFLIYPFLALGAYLGFRFFKKK